MAQESDTITVEILGTKLQLRGGDDPDKVRHIAHYVQDCVHELAERAPTVPSLQLALLTAINIADELYAQQEQSQEGKQLRAAIEKANQILDKAESV